MNGVLVLALFGLFSAAYSADNVCKNLKEGTLVPNRYDCSKFYECAQGKMVEMNCNPGLEFNEIDNMCDSPQNSACHAFKLGSHGRGSKLQKLCEAYGDGTLLPDITDCSKFYECTYGKPVQLACTTGLQYSTATKACDYPKDTVCATSLPKINNPGGIIKFDN